MSDNPAFAAISEARKNKRQQIIEAALALVGVSVSDSFDPVHSPLCAIDIVMVAGAPWLKVAIERDYTKDESGYKKIGGGANSPKMAYFFRSATNLMHFLKRQGLYIPRGAQTKPESGMACFLDWADRGRFNFAPDRSGIIIDVDNGSVKKVVLPRLQKESEDVYKIEIVSLAEHPDLSDAIIGYSDLP